MSNDSRCLQQREVNIGTVYTGREGTEKWMREVGSRKAGRQYQCRRRRQHLLEAENTVSGRKDEKEKGQPAKLELQRDAPEAKRRPRKGWREALWRHSSSWHLLHQCILWPNYPAARGQQSLGNGAVLRMELRVWRHRAASLTIKGATACWSVVRACMDPVTGMAAGRESLSNDKNSKRRDLEISQWHSREHAEKGEGGEKKVSNL